MDFEVTRLADKFSTTEYSLMKGEARNALRVKLSL